MFSRVGSNPVGGSFLFYFYGEKIWAGAAKIWPQGESAFCEGLKISHYFLRSHLRYHNLFLSSSLLFLKARLDSQLVWCVFVFIPGSSGPRSPNNQIEQLRLPICVCASEYWRFTYSVIYPFGDEILNYVWFGSGTRSFVIRR
jgi:hypothetical protein